MSLLIGELMSSGSCWAFVGLWAHELTCPALLSIYRSIKGQDDFIVFFMHANEVEQNDY